MTHTVCPPATSVFWTVIKRPPVGFLNGRAQRLQRRCLGCIGRCVAVPVPPQVGRKDAVDHVNVIQQTDGGVPLARVCVGIESLQGLKEFLIGPGLVLE